MSLADRIAAAERAELDCLAQRVAATARLGHLKSEIRRGATPVRIVVSGFALGVASGFSAPALGAAGAAGGRLASGPLFSMLLETVVPGLLAGITAAVVGEDEDEEDADAETTQDPGQDEDDADVDSDEGGHRAQAG